MKKILLLLCVIVGCWWASSAGTVTDVITYDKILNTAFTDVAYNSPESGVNYLSSLYATQKYVNTISFQNNEGSMRTAISAAAPDGLTAKAVNVVWHPDPLDPHKGHTLVVYGSDTPYASSLDVYDEAKRGTELGRVTYPETTINVSGDYANIVLVMELPKTHIGDVETISFDWKTQSITDVITYDKIFNTAFTDVAYNSPESGVNYLSSLYATQKYANTISFQNNGSNMRTAIAGAASNGLTLDAVSVVWHPDPIDPHKGHTLVVYGSDTPYASSLDVYDESKRGTELGRVTYPDTKISVSGKYANIVLVMELPKTHIGDVETISFDWAGDVAKAIEPIIVKTAAGDVIETGAKLNVFEPLTLTIETATPDVTYEWTLGDKTGTATGKFTLEVTEDATLTVVATKEGYNSRDFSAVFTYYPPVTSIANFWLRHTLFTQGVDQDFRVDFDATVVYVANVVPMSSDSGKLPDGQIYITDGTHFARIYMIDKSSDLKPGDVIAAGWTAKYRNYAGWKDFLPQGELTVKSHDGVVPAPVAIGNEEALEALCPGTPVIITKVTLTSDTKPDVYTGDVDYINTFDCGVNLVNAFGLPSQVAGVYDVYGIADFYGYNRTNAPAVGPTDGDYNRRRWRVAVTRYEEWLPTAPRPRFELATGAEVDSGEPIVITCQDAEATIMYRFDEEEYAVYNPENKPVMPARDVTVSAYAVKEGNHDSAVRTVSLKYSGKAGIEAISADGAGEARYYDLQGRPVAKPATGLYIKVENGKAGKVAL